LSYAGGQTGQEFPEVDDDTKSPSGEELGGSSIGAAVIELRVAGSSTERLSKSIKGRCGGLPKRLGVPSAPPLMSCPGLLGYTELFLKTLR
jgi:hypothetical protein